MRIPNLYRSLPALTKLFFAIATMSTPLFTPAAHAQVVTNFAGGGAGATGSNGVAATSVSLNGILGISQDKAGNILFASDTRHCAHRVDSGGFITRLAGNASCTTQIGFFDTAATIGDNGLATAAAVKLGNSSFIVSDKLGNTFIGSYRPDARMIRKVDNAGIITTLAGRPSAQGNSGDDGPSTAALLNTPLHAAVDANNNLLFSDENNRSIRKISPSGLITRVAGGGADTSENAEALNAPLFEPRGIAIAGDGTIYIVAGTSVSTTGARIRKITPDGKINTIAGNGVVGFAGDGGQALNARFTSAAGLSLDPSGTLYIADQANHRIRKIARNGTVSTVIGNGVGAGVTPGVHGANNQVQFPNVVHADNDGSLYFSYANANGVRKITAPRMAVVLEQGTVVDGTNATFVASLVDTTLTGTMTFRENGIDISGCGDVPIVAGVAKCATSYSEPGTHTVVAGYSGMATASTLNPTGVYSTIGAAASTSFLVLGLVPITMRVAADSLGLGQISAVTQTAPIGSAAPFTVTANPRHVMRFNNALNANCGTNKTSSPQAFVPIGTGTDTFVTDIINGACTVEVSFVPLIPKVNVSTEMLANTLFAATERSQVYAPPASPTPTSSTLGAAVTFKAWVTDIAGVPYAGASNVLNFKANGTTIPGCVAVPLTLRASNVIHIREAKCTTQFTPAGSVTITAEFGGDTYNFPAASAALNHSVLQ